MKVEYNRCNIKIIPETEIETVYLEEVLSLKAKGDKCEAERIAPISLEYELAYIKIEKVK